MACTQVTLEEDESLKSIAEAAGCAPKELVELNRLRIKGIHERAELQRGTTLRTCREARAADEYTHWSFPEDESFEEEAHPSYMMARRLKPPSQRRDHNNAAPTAAEAEDPDVLTRSLPLLVSRRPSVQPSRANPELAAIVGGVEAARAEAEARGQRAPPAQLFDKVVRIQGETRHEYWCVLTCPPDLQRCACAHGHPLTCAARAWHAHRFVLTYLPDLQWCRVAPLEPRGTLPNDHKHKGRPQCPSAAGRLS